MRLVRTFLGKREVNLSFEVECIKSTLIKLAGATKMGGGVGGAADMLKGRTAIWSYRE